MPLIISNWIGGTPRRIADDLDWKLARPSLKERKANLICNWGTSHPIVIRHGAVIINSPAAVAQACSKLNTLRQLHASRVPCLDFTMEKTKALEWLNAGKSVVCRDRLQGKGGDGVRVIVAKSWKENGRQDFAPAKVYTKYFPKKIEARIHVFKNEIIGYYEKRHRKGEEANYWIRNHGEGWIFAAPLKGINDLACEAARNAVSALGLDFGAVDIGILDNTVSVFEVNTAPGLEGRTLQAYEDAIRKLANA